MSIPHPTDQFYSGVIERVINSMRVPLLNEGYEEDIVQKIRRNWSESMRQSLRNPPATRPVVLVMPETERPVKEEEEVEEEVPELEEEEEEIIEDSFNSLEDEEDASEADEEAAMIFKLSKAEEEKAKLQNQPNREMIKQDFMDDHEDEESLPSDNETDIAHPHADDEMICMYNNVTRKGNKWKLTLTNCVLQTKNISHHIIRNVSGTLNF